MTSPRRLRAFAASIPLAFGAAASAQDPLPLRAREVATPERPTDVFFVDADGDGDSDLLTTATGPAIYLRRREADGSFGPPRFASCPDGVVGIVVGRVGAAPALFFADGSGGGAPLLFKNFADAGAVTPKVGPPSPPLLSYAVDLDGDDLPDAVFPDVAGATVARSGGGRTKIRPPARVERSCGDGGLAVRTRVYPRTSFERLARGAPAVPAFMEAGALYRLAGSWDEGFGPEALLIAGAPADSTVAEGVLERNEGKLVDLDGDGTPEIVHVRTATTAGALGGARTTVVVRRVAADAAKPLQAILLPGVISNGPDFRDLDGDGRLDLSLSVFGDDLKSRITRGLKGSTELRYFVYRGIAGPTPFDATPASTSTDDVPAEHFDVWSLRHRRIFDEDWSGDGLPDLLVVDVGASKSTIAMFPGTGGGRVAFSAHPARRVELPYALTDFRAWALGPGVPALICRAEGRVIVVSIE